MNGHLTEHFAPDGKGGYRTDYYGNVLTGSGTRNGESGKPWKGFDPTAKGRHWAFACGRPRSSMTSSARARPECEVLDAAGTRDQAESHLRLAEYRRLSRGKAHVARQHEFAAGAANVTFDVRNGDEAAGAQVAKQQSE